MWGSVVSGVLDVFKARSERKQEANRLRTDLIKSKDSHNHSWEIAALEGEGVELAFIRVVAFLEVSLITWYVVFDPKGGQLALTALATVPEWILGLKVTIFGWAFASTPVKAAAAGLVGSVLRFPKGQSGDGQGPH